MYCGMQTNREFVPMKYGEHVRIYPFFEMTEAMLHRITAPSPKAATLCLIAVNRNVIPPAVRARGDVEEEYTQLQCFISQILAETELGKSLAPLYGNAKIILPYFYEDWVTECLSAPYLIAEKAFVKESVTLEDDIIWFGVCAKVK